MSQKVVVLIGASYSGLAFIHNLLGKIFPNLPGYDVKSDQPSPYRLVVLTPEDSFFGRHGGPRLISDPDSVSGGASQGFVPLKEALGKRYANESRPEFGAFEIVAGKAVSIDKSGRTVTYAPSGTAEGTQTAELKYNALVIASGFNTDVWFYNPLDAGETVDSRVSDMAAFHKKVKELPKGSVVVVGGGGPTGVETAAEIAEQVNPPAPGLFQSSGSKGSDSHVRVILVTGDSRLLPSLGNESVSERAKNYLERLGVEVKTGTRITSPSRDALAEAEAANGRVASLTTKTTIELDGQNEPIQADVYLPCMGTRPNNSFIPDSWLVSGQSAGNPLSNTFPAPARLRPGTVKVDKDSLIVEGLAPEEGLVFAIGEIADAASPSLFWIEGMGPVAASRLGNAWYAEATGSDSKDKAAPEARFKTPNNHTKGRVMSFVPVGKTRGTGVLDTGFMGAWTVNWVLVWLAKSRNFMIPMIRSKVGN